MHKICIRWIQYCVTRSAYTVALDKLCLPPFFCPRACIHWPLFLTSTSDCLLLTHSQNGIRNNTLGWFLLSPDCIFKQLLSKNQVNIQSQISSTVLYTIVLIFSSTHAHICNFSIIPFLSSGVINVIEVEYLVYHPFFFLQNVLNNGSCNWKCEKKDRNVAPRLKPHFKWRLISERAISHELWQCVAGWMPCGHFKFYADCDLTLKKKR